MNWYKVTLSLAGPTGTPWQADTIFGHLCWVLRHRHGESALQQFMEPFLRGQPSFLISDGFPSGLLPRPLSHTTPHHDTPQALREQREARKLAYLAEQDFLRALRGESFIPQPPKQDASLSSSRVTTKNQISRLTGTTGQGGQLFSFIEYWTPRVTIYLRIRDGNDAQVRELFQGLAQAGYGKRKSVGYGAITSHTFEPFDGFPAPQGANAFVSLSPFVPAATDPTEGRWRTMVKYGRLGEEFALDENPFKRPLLMLTAGSVFFDTPVREFYGRMVSGMSLVHPEVVQYGYALPVPMRLPKARGEAKP